MNHRDMIVPTMLVMAVLAFACRENLADRYRARHSHYSHFHEPGAEYTQSDLYAPATTGQLKRAGHPHLLSTIAKPGDTHHHHGYYVGGGSASHAKSRARCLDEGTWGWDYIGHWLPRRVGLDWWAKPKYQGGSGSYEPDGPKLIELEH